MHIALYASGEIIVDDLSDASEIHATCHHFCADHYPALPPTHSADCIIAFFLGHSRVKTVDIWNPIQNKLLSKGARTRLRGREYEDWRVVRL